MPYRHSSAPAITGPPLAGASDARHRAIFEQSGQGIALVDAGFVITAANPALCALLGYGEAELTGRDYRQLICRRNLEVLPFRFQDVLSGSAITQSRTLKRKDGGTVQVDVSIRRISPDEVVMVFWDKTTTLGHEQALTHERKRLRDLLDSLPGPVWALRGDLSLAAANAAYHSMAGEDRKCFCAHSGSCGPHPCDQCPTRLVHATGAPQRRECTLEDGRVMLIDAVPFLDEDGEPLSLGLAVDITAQKKLERELTEARTAAEEATRAKSEFLAAVSHDILTPLNSVLGHLQILQEGRLDDSQAESVRMALGSGRLLIRLIDDLLDVSRMESGNFSITREDFSLGDIADAVASVFSATAESKGLALTCEAPRLEARSDPARITQIALNLAGNAVKYTTEGFVRVRLNLQRQGQGMALLLHVEDSGPGIPEDKREAVFESYTQLGPTARSSSGGVGLGLSIVKRMAEAMGGQVHLTSASGKGTAVTVRIPVEPPSVALEERGKGPVRSLRVLVADDERVNQMVIAKALATRGHAVRAAFNGLEAIEALREERFDLVLMDINMPVMDGLEASHAIRSGEAGEAARTVTIAALSAHSMADGGECLARAGMDDHLDKPLELSELDRLLARVARRPA